MNLEQQTIESYQQTLSQLQNSEPGSEAQQTAIKQAGELMKNPYLSYPLKQGLEALVYNLQRQEEQPERSGGSCSVQS